LYINRKKFSEIFSKNCVNNENIIKILFLSKFLIPAKSRDGFYFSSFFINRFEFTFHHVISTATQSAKCVKGCLPFLTTRCFIESGAHYEGCLIIAKIWKLLGWLKITTVVTNWGKKRRAYAKNAKIKPKMLRSTQEAKVKPNILISGWKHQALSWAKNNK